MSLWMKKLLAPYGYPLSAAYYWYMETSYQLFYVAVYHMPHYNLTLASLIHVNLVVVILLCVQI